MKKNHRFLIPDNLTEKTITLTNTDLLHLIRNVLRLKVGEQCILFNGGGDDLLCTISNISENSVTFDKQEITKKIKIPKRIIACISITKRDSFELIVQKLTELGIQKIVPILSGRTVKQSLRIDRLQKISDEALELSGGSDRVNIASPLPLKDALEMYKDSQQYYFDIDGALYQQAQASDIVFYIGPEGGWSEEDKQLFAKYEAVCIKLGNTILRAETAAIVAVYKLVWG